MVRLVAAVSDALVPNRPDRVGVVPGAIAWDDCQCGQLVVSLARIYESDAFPSELGQVINCPAALLVGELIVQIIRCVPLPADNEISVPIVALQESAATVTTDAWTTIQTVSCELQVMRDDDRDIYDYLVQSQQVVGPEGGCVGSELHVLVGLVR